MDATSKARLRAMVGKKTASSCSDCGAVMVVRQNRQDESFFLGCNQYPYCKHTEEITEELYMELIGHPKLF
jgi:ssDNA-binding Zn-finger/Zn-ribbon topoisomerase 1